MKKTLVLVVDRDDDFGVKGKVNTPVVGVQNCLDAATAFGIADPEDSDLNALYAAISVCLEIQEAGREADVALICGDQKVGHISDLALVAQLEEVLEDIDPDSVVLVGDGAEDEYIYPIISSRAHVDSVRKVYVKQAPGIEGTLYILTRMMSDPDKRRRFLAPVGGVLMVLSLFFLVPELLLFMSNGDLSLLTAFSWPLVTLIVGLTVLLYAYNFTEVMYELRKRVKRSLSGKTTSIIFLCLSMTLILVMALYTYMELENMYIIGVWTTVVYFISGMIWPIVLAMVLYELGNNIEMLTQNKVMDINLAYNSVGLVSLGLAATGILDLLMMNMDYGYGWQVGILEIASGIVVSIVLSVVKQRLSPVAEEEVVVDEVA